MGDPILKNRVPFLISRIALCLLLCVSVGASLLPGKKKKDAVQYGTGLIVNVALPEDEVSKVVGEVTQNGLIRGSKEYSKDEFVTGAIAATTAAPVFPEWTEGGKVFYKLKVKAIDPLNFKDTNDVGTLAVRYVVQPQNEKNTILRIDALFVDDSRRTKHASNGSVESSEYKDIQDRLDAIELVKRQAIEAENQRQEQLARKQNLGWNDTTSANALAAPAQSSLPASVPAQPISAPAPHTETIAPPITEGHSEQLPAEVALAPGESLEEHVANLRREVERTVKVPGAPLKSAPFHSASTVKALKPGTEVLILISTPYWYGIETHDGDHGWIAREQVEQLR